MLQKVREYVREWNMLQGGDHVIAGISGGADSMCLALMLLTLQKETGFSLTAVHVNHGLRGDIADSDEAFVKDFCAANNIPCRCYHADVGDVARKKRQSTEEAGRDIRRECFKKALDESGGNKIALAHHQNDNAETFLLNLARGTGLKGLCGIHPVRGNIIRPLLCLQRHEIEEYLAAVGADYRQDMTNQSDDYTRNRIRNHVIPYLEKEINAKAVAHMQETMERLHEANEFMEEQVGFYYRQCVKKICGNPGQEADAEAAGEEGRETDAKQKERSGCCYLLDEEGYNSVPRTLRPLLIRRILAKLAGREKDLMAVHIRQTGELMAKQAGRRLNLPYGIEAKRAYRGIEFRKNLIIKADGLHAASDSGFSYAILRMNNPGETYRVKDMVIRCRIVDVGDGKEEDKRYGTPPEEDEGKSSRYKMAEAGAVRGALENEKSTEKKYTAQFDYDIIDGDIIFRTRRPGDYITVYDDGRTQKLKAYMVNEKIPEEERDKIILAAMGSHVLWIAGYRRGQALRVGDKTKHILEVRVLPA